MSTNPNEIAPIYSTTCRRCKRPLSNDASRRLGFGPVCLARARAAEARQTWREGADAERHPSALAADAVICERHGYAARTNVPRLVTLHSSTGFEFGYGGSGPADLALNILLLFSGDEAFAQRQHQSFKWQFVATMEREGGRIEGETIRRWIAERRQEAAS